MVLLWKLKEYKKVFKNSQCKSLPHFFFALIFLIVKAFRQLTSKFRKQCINKTLFTAKILNKLRKRLTPAKKLK